MQHASRPRVYGVPFDPIPQHCLEDSILRVYARIKNGRVRISSTFSVLRPKLYFDLNLTSTFFWPNFTLFVLAKLYFDQNCTLTCASRPISPDLTKCRSTEVEVQEKSTNRKGRTDAYPMGHTVWPIPKSFLLLSRGHPIYIHR